MRGASKSLAKELAVLSAMPAAQLAETWTSLTDEPLPSVAVGLQRRLLAQRLQEKRLGGLPALVARELARIGDASPATAATPRTAISLTPGARLVREWNGRTIVVDVREDGFTWEGQHYRSLSMIARAVTGAQWSGPRFFGLRSHG
ncbi:MAG: DUF2924 domain-containing protein [Alphaproteobacteria bacterium]|nr:DUF2924 domain-containing protein [Alphaproteobacteria bacterium]MBU0794247.1 DUF2924 domain-containing protein [Alphaproteobacteria bacterium]MBU0876593.1 DUF2924 domain-containing protein [Alphaproteobacteria bacterium]MBU1769294.1 DUF2924 domain-containing protein [Alphaproteobacteria bacterium]